MREEVEVEKVVAPLRLLELFSGTGSIGRSFEACGWEVISVDSDPKAQATINTNISGWDCSSLLGNKVKVIWASRPLHELQLTAKIH